ISTGPTRSIGVYIDGNTNTRATTINNSGVITADDAINQAGGAAVHLINSGTIDGRVVLSYNAADYSTGSVPTSEIDNSGIINGSIIYGDENIIYSGAQGSQVGGIFL